MPAFCPTCRGLMRPQKGALVCIRCTAAAKSRTVVAGGRSIRLGAGQQGLSPMDAEAGAGGSGGAGRAGGAGGPGLGGRAFDPPLAPKETHWQPKVNAGAKPHPQFGLFPHDEIRDGQRRFTRDVTLAVQAGKHLVAQAPTGIGKTAAALAPALAHALAAKKTVMFLTSRQSQHRIAVETLRLIRQNRGAQFSLVDLVSKRDMCLRPEAKELHPARFADFCGRETRTKSCPYLGDVDSDTLRRVQSGVLHVEELMAVSKKAMLCPHLVALAAAKDAQVVIADYNHLFSDLREQSLQRLGVELGDLVLIVDEAHNLPDRIRQNHAHRITPYLLDMVEGEARDHKANAIVADLAALRLAMVALAASAETDGRAGKASLGDDDRRVARLDPEQLHEAFGRQRNQGTLSSLGLHRTLQDCIDELGPLATKVKKGTDAQVYADELRAALDDWGRFRTGGLRFLQWQAEAIGEVVEADRGRAHAGRGLVGNRPRTPAATSSGSGPAPIDPSQQGIDAGSVELHIRLLDPAVPARSVFERVHATIVMSGTLRPPEIARDLLGLDAARTTVRTYPSPFPPENRIIVVGKGFTTRFKDRGDDLWRRMAAEVAEVASAARGNVAVFAPSYAILDRVREAIGALPDVGKESIVEVPGLAKSERDRVLDTLDGARRKRGGALLWGVLGGSFSEGVDFRDNLLSAVIVVGLPLAPPDLEIEATIGYFERRFPGRGRDYGYTIPAMNKVLQAMGRPIRSATDRAAIVLLDERYLQQPYRSLLPDDPAPVASAEPGFTASSFVAAHGL